ncbi:MAG: hypothetical protein Q9204_006870, partial [Flavoplaca sp. TL-2023a]
MGPRRKVMFPLFGDGIFTQEGDAWKHSRELLRPQFVHKQHEDLELFQEVVDDLISVLPTKEVEFTSACEDVHRFADQIIDRNLSRKLESSDQGKYVILDFLEENTSSRKELRSQIINILVAGRDTTACLLSWTLFLLVRHPKVLAKLREEISSKIKGSTKITRSVLQSMTYLQNVLKE